MRCPNCNSLIADDINFCNYCGTPLKDIDNQTPKENIEINNNSSDEDYLKAYIGDNYQDFRKKSFNIYAFLLGQYYYLYRKAYLYFFIDLLILIITIMTGSIGSIISIIYRVFISIKFNELYYNNAKKEVEIIKQVNTDKSINELKNICKKKGGVNSTLPFLYMGVLFILSFILIFLIIIFSDDTTEDNPFNEIIETIKEEEAIGNLNYKLPEGFEESIDFDNTKTYYYLDTNTMEAYTITLTYQMNKTYESGKDYLENYSNEVIKQNINNVDWYYYKNNNSYYYSTIYNNYLYYIEFSSIKGSAVKDNLKNTFINSLNFNNKNIDTNKNKGTSEV